MKSGQYYPIIQGFDRVRRRAQPAIPRTAQILNEEELGNAQVVGRCASRARAHRARQRVGIRLRLRLWLWLRRLWLRGLRLRRACLWLLRGARLWLRGVWLRGAGLRLLRGASI